MVRKELPRCKDCGLALAANESPPRCGACRQARTDHFQGR